MTSSVPRWVESLHKLVWPTDTYKTNFDDLLEERSYDIPIFPLSTNYGLTKNIDFQHPPEPMSIQKVKSLVLDLGRHEHFDPKHARDMTPSMMREILVIDDYKTLPKAFIEMDEDYKDEYTRTGVNPGNERASVILGSPGIGKSCCLTYILVDRLCNGKETVYVMDRGTYWWFSKLGAKRYNFFEDIDAVFIDANTDLIRDAWILYDSCQPPVETKLWHCNIIQASSPQKSKYKEWIKQHKGLVWLVDAWNWKEYATIGRLAKTKNIYGYWVMYTRFGGIPRVAIAMGVDTRLFKVKFHNYDEGLRIKAQEYAAKDPSSSIPKVMLSSESHNIITLRPKLLDDSSTKANMKREPQPTVHFDAGETHLITPYVEILVGEMYTESLRSKAYDYFQKLLDVKATRSAAGKAFELMMHELFSYGNVSEVSESFVSLESPDSTTVLKKRLQKIDIVKGKYQFGTTRDLRALIDALAPNPSVYNDNNKTAKWKHGYYFQPISQIFKSIDSFYVAGVDADFYKPVLFQITVGSQHDVLADRLQEVWDCLPKEMTKNGAYLIFVTPAEEGRAQLRKQLIQPMSQRDTWNRRLHQMEFRVSLTKLSEVWHHFGKKQEDVLNETPYEENKNGMDIDQY